MNRTYQDMMDLYFDLKNYIKKADKRIYDRWKAGGFIVDEDIISNYPNLGEVIQELEDRELEEDGSNEY